MRLTQNRYRYGIFGSRGLEGNNRADKLLAFIKTYVAQSGGVAPSFREMRDGAGVSSTNQVSRLIRTLEAAGKIRCMHGKARAMELVQQPAVYFTVSRVNGEAVLLPMRKDVAA